MHLSSLFTVSAAIGVVHGYANVQVSQLMLKNIDPIVSPGKYESHMHTFFGSDAITKNVTTSKELQAGCTTVKNPNDLSAYWIPTLYHVAGTEMHPITPALFSVYYENIEAAEIPIPQNYHAVIGNPSGKSQFDVPAGSGAKWFCEGDKANEYQQSTGFPTHTCSSNLQFLLYFHDCVDTVSLKSAYSKGGRCAGNMKRMPRLRYSVRYNLKRIMPNGWSGAPPLKLACGSSYCAHGDFINGWVEDAARNMLKSRGQHSLVPVDGSRGKQGARPNCKPVDRDPKGGTSDYKIAAQQGEAHH
ncbi:hypothetical protein BT63DRAFT_480487 [Microthyrium microscopicum]|uniref:DUF1996 domain-containing protein n=1 Tax=Microthyrium microscopicum TaxID=703497 RepID=A0A6A6U8V7_9PEZI|nr:hypothetical protein BT63DRAFT_480487 [Microthyrium microscopicum]